MIGLVLLTNGRLAEDLRAAVARPADQVRVATVGLDPDDDIDGKRAELASRIDEVDTGEGAILMTDGELDRGELLGRLVTSMPDRPGLEMLDGLDVPALIEAASWRGEASP